MRKAPKKEKQNAPWQTQLLRLALRRRLVHLADEREVEQSDEDGGAALDGPQPPGADVCGDHGVDVARGGQLLRRSPWFLVGGLWWEGFGGRGWMRWSRIVRVSEK